MKRAGFLIFVLGVFAILSGITAVRLLGGGEESQGGWGGRSTPVAAQEVALMEFADVVEALGTARAAETVSVTARVSDTISRINFDSGQRVEAGDILVELTDEEEAADQAEARATQREGERDLARVRDLIDRGVVPQSRLDEAAAVVERAEARVASIEARLADRIVRAPFSGVIGLREVSPGQLVGPGDSVARLDDTSTIKLDFTVPERFLAVLEAGVEVRSATSAYPDEIFNGLVSQVDTRIDPVTRAVTVRAEIDNADGRLLPGQLMTVEMRRDIRMRPAVPGAAVTRYLDQAYVFVVAQNEQGARALRRDVVLGLRQDGWVEIVDGLQAGDVIVAEGVHRIRDGSPVSVVGLNTDGPSGEAAAGAVAVAQ